MDLSTNSVISEAEGRLKKALSQSTLLNSQEDLFATKSEGIALSDPEAFLLSCTKKQKNFHPRTG
ncbi:MAG: hypothetical protein KKG99_13505 [Bacteroidetes bacterium]|nr:hypothetical protein [Bacteroidota bacterium]